MAPQVVLTVPLLEGLDGVQKMSKSLGNYVGIDETPNEQFGKLMSISDELMWKYYHLLSDLPLPEIHTRKTEVMSGSFHPKEAKSELAKEIVSRFHSTGAAAEAEREFNKVHVGRRLPSKIDTEQVELVAGLTILDLLVRFNLVASKSDARRLTQQGGVRVNQTKIDDVNAAVDSAEDLLLQVGKRRFLKVTFCEYPTSE